MKRANKFFVFIAIITAIIFLPRFSRGETNGPTCLPAQEMFSLAKESGEMLFGEGYTSPTERDPYRTKISMMYDRETTEWSFLATNEENGKTCFIEGGKQWAKLPYVFPPSTVHGGEYEEHLGRCDSFEQLSRNLLVNNHKIDIGYGPQPDTSFPPNSGIAIQETHFFVDGVGGWTIVYKTTYTRPEASPLACIQASGFGWKFLDYYESHLPKIGK